MMRYNHSMPESRERRHRVRYLSQVNNDIRSLDPSILQRIQHAIETKLFVRPDWFGKPLRAPMAGYWRLRVGDYRIVYTIDHSNALVTIIAIAHRSTIYKKI